MVLLGYFRAQFYNTYIIVHFNSSREASTFFANAWIQASNAIYKIGRYVVLFVHMFQPYRYVSLILSGLSV